MVSAGFLRKKTLDFENYMVLDNRLKYLINKMNADRREFIKFVFKAAAGFVASAEMAKIQYIRRTLQPTDKPFLPNTEFNRKVFEVATADYRKKRLQEWFWNANIPFGDEKKTPFQQATEAFAESDLSDFLKARGPFMFFQESGYDPTKVSESDAAGIAQIKADTMEDYGFSPADRFNPKIATKAAIMHLKKCKDTIRNSEAYRIIHKGLELEETDETLLDLLTLNAYNAGQSRIIAALQNFLTLCRDGAVVVYENMSVYQIFTMITETATVANSGLLEKYTTEASEYVYKITTLYELDKMYQKRGDPNEARRKELGIYYAIAENEAEVKAQNEKKEKREKREKMRLDWNIEAIRGVAQIDFWSTEIDPQDTDQNFEKVRSLADAHYHLGNAFAEGKSGKYLWPTGKIDPEEARGHRTLATHYYSLLWNVLTSEQKEEFRYFQSRIQAMTKS